MNQERIDLLKKFRSEDPSDPFPLYGLAMEYQHEKPVEAGLLFDQVLAEFPDYLPVYYTAAHFLLEQGKEERAKDLLKKGIALAVLQNDAKAIRELQSALEQLEF